FNIMKQHPELGHNILQDMSGIGDIPLDIALHHHERMDGSGYPEKQSGDKISMLAQMTAIVDVYDAITSDRVYHRGMAAADALRRIYEWSKFHFNPEHVHAFIRCIGIYPVGTMVLMESGHLAVVVEPHENKPLSPSVKLFFNTKTNTYIPPVVVDLSKPFGGGGGNHILGHESAEKWKVDPLRFLDLT
ncbi:MAG: HD domain-containing phosphohydrolase, partial [Burkholderiaceae bacterium]|nr:HD domain-containing phosphohydrolase [Burkholderiaceae bacterium]